jgi:hypothetical protein
MDRKVLIGILSLAFAIWAGSYFLLENKAPNDRDTIPWHIEHPTADTMHVLGITLGKSSITEAESKYRQISEFSLFKSASGKLQIEAFFEEVVLNGLKARITAVIDVPEAEIGSMYERGLRMSSTGSGNKRITMTPEDTARVRQLPIISLAYQPNINIEIPVLLKRFGEPAQRVKETKTGFLHLLYPQHGLDIVLADSTKPAFQYVLPKNFSLLSEPLLANGEIVKP